MEEEGGVRRSLRDKRKKPESSGIASIREAMKGGKIIDKYTASTAGVYKEVDEEEYKKIKDRKLRFVVEDDDGLGYDDGGEEDLENDEDEEDFGEFEEAEVEGHGPKRAKRARVASTKPVKEKKPEPLPSQRLAALMKGASAAAQKAPTTRKDPPANKPAKAGGDDDLEAMLADLQNNPKDKQASKPAPKLSKLSFTPVASKTQETEKKQTAKSTSPVSQPKSKSKPAPKSDDNDEFMADIPDSAFDDVDLPAAQPTTTTAAATPAPTPASAPTSAPSSTSSSTPASKATAKDTPQKKKVEIQDDETIEEWWSSASVVPEETSKSVELSKSSLGDLQFYWFDALEDYHHKGTIYLFGKIFLESEKKFVSCTVTIKNMQRCVFIAPRQLTLDENDIETDEVPTKEDVNKELEPIRQRLGIKKWISKVVTRKYCFDGHPDVPRGESKYIKAKYDAAAEPIPSDTKGKTFSHIFGTHSSLLELFLLKRKVMGPCWLKVKNASVVSEQVSWSKSHVSVGSMSDITVMAADEAPPAPALSVLSLKVATVQDEATHTNEIIMVSGIFHGEVNLDGPTNDPQKKFLHFTAVRALKAGTLPFGFEKDIKKHPSIQPCSNERALLSCVTGKISSLDPDIIVGHNFLGFDLDVLLHRMESNKIVTWSKLGRLNNSRMPKLQSGRESSWAEKGVMAGRLVCDTWISSKELLREKNYRLTDLAESQLGMKRREIETEDVPAYYETSDGLLALIKHTEHDCFIAISLMFKLMLIPLSKQLTNISGNLWSHSLMGRKAERIEYLLLHSFHGEKFIVPDKASYKEKMDKKVKDGDGQSIKSKKPKYAGGLVLEPEQGLYDKYVLLLDFNSLYPSIIQEHNICFTTTERNMLENGTWDLATPPPQDTKPGVVPRVLKFLVDCRKTVKNEMKAETNQVKLRQLDIRQQAIKLVANSMYGCLGFVFSRFYAHPLAELVTRKGREALQRAVGIAKSNNYHVIYGDTDSIMINTNRSDVEEARNDGLKLKKLINEHSKLLEIDIDFIYKSILLQKKKKYAALQVTGKRQDGTPIVVRQAKGLDLVRRDWCDLSKDIGNAILDHILSGKPREEIIESIHQHLRSVKDDIAQNKIPLSKFTITKGLTKDPSQYQDAKSQPHVQVALKMKNTGKQVRAGDCEGEGSPAERAFAPDQIERSDGMIRVDTNWYLHQQILPPVSRLCENIQGTDIPQLAGCLGLDPSKYNRTVVTSTYDADNYFAPSSEMDADEKFKTVEKFQIQCRLCGQTEVFPGIFRDYTKRQTGLTCKCGEIYTAGLLQNQLELAFRAALQKLYEGWLECDEHSCKNRTRQPHFYKTHARCIVPGCKGVQRLEMTPENLYTQLQYYQHIFDIDKFKPTGKQIAEPVRDILNMQEQSTFAVLHKRAGQYLAKNTLNHVNLGSWFSYYDVIKKPTLQATPTVV